MKEKKKKEEEKKEKKRKEGKKEEGGEEAGKEKAGGGEVSLSASVLKNLLLKTQIKSAREGRRDVSSHLLRYPCCPPHIWFKLWISMIYPHF